MPENYTLYNGGDAINSRGPNVLTAAAAINTRYTDTRRVVLTNRT